jgi:hypothetical protein
MSDFNLEQRKVIYNAVRYYQMNAVSLTGKTYQTCDEILNSLFEECKMQVEPAYQIDERI